MQTPYGELEVGDRYLRADGSSGVATVIDVQSYASCEDAVIEHENGNQNRIDWFKLMRVRYYKEEIPFHTIKGI
jgi:hypothetical protein